MSLGLFVAIEAERGPDRRSELRAPTNCFSGSRFPGPQVPLRFQSPLRKKDALPSSPLDPPSPHALVAFWVWFLKELGGIQAGACQESAVSSQREAGAGPGEWRALSTGVAQLGCFKLQPGFQRSCRLRSPKTLPLEKPSLPLCWPLLAWLTALGTPPPPGAGRWLPGARPRPQAALEVEAAGPSLLAPLTPSPSATGSLPSQAQCPRRERPGQQAPRVAGILDRVWGIFPLGAGPTET